LNKTLSPLLILVSFLFGQSGGQNLEKYLETLTVMVGMNQSFYGSEWNDYMKDAEDSGTDVDLKPFRKMNFTVMNEFKEGLIGGVKYLHYGYDYKFSGISYDSFSDMSLNWSSDSEIELKFYKLFLTYPMNNGLYLGVEGVYFVEGESDFKYEDGYSDGGTFDREDFEDNEPPLSTFDYGVLGQFYYNINENMLATVEGYYGLSKFTEDWDADMIGIPNVFHYVNLGIASKFGKK
tara:strand:+ start:142 stop:846 length:705 start_codon:yes stop_codon:yes gene_type:complete